MGKFQPNHPFPSFFNPIHSSSFFTVKRCQDLPGFYYDAEKNMYFPLKSPIPGSSSRHTSSASTSIQLIRAIQAHKQVKDDGQKGKVVKMVQVWEFCGNYFICNKKKVNFREQYENIQASKPTIWKSEGTGKAVDAALENVYVNIEADDGLVESELLLTGGLNRTFGIQTGVTSTVIENSGFEPET